MTARDETGESRKSGVGQTTFERTFQPAGALVEIADPTGSLSVGSGELAFGAGLGVETSDGSVSIKADGCGVRLTVQLDADTYGSGRVTLPPTTARRVADELRTVDDWQSVEQTVARVSGVDASVRGKTVSANQIPARESRVGQLRATGEPGCVHLSLVSDGDDTRQNSTVAFDVRYDRLATVADMLTDAARATETEADE